MMNTKLVTVALLTALAVPSFADDRFYAKAVEASIPHSAAYISNLTDTVPQFVTGGGWATTITLINFRSTAVTVPVKFYLDGGAALEVPILGLGNRSSVDVNLPAGGSATIATDPAAAGNVRVGFARMTVPCTSPTACGEIGGFAVFTQRVAGRPDFEAVVPMASSLAGKYVISMDNTAGFATGVAVAAPTYSATETGNRTVVMTVKDENGNVLHTENLDLKANGHTSFSIKTRVPALADKRGTIEFTTSAFVSVLGLRFQDQGSFTSTPAYER